MPDPSVLTGIVSLVLSLGAIVGAIVAYGRSSRTTESQVISVTVEAAENVVQMVTNQLERSARDYDELAGRLKKVEEALIKEQGRTASLTMELGKMRKRVTQLEGFITSHGWTPPPEEEH